jgi:hypothetical protein
MPSRNPQEPATLRDEALLLLRKLYRVRIHQGSVIYTTYSQAQIAEELGYSPSQFSRLMQPSDQDDKHQRLLTRLRTVDRLGRLQRQRKGLLSGLIISTFMLMAVLVFTPIPTRPSPEKVPAVLGEDNAILLNRAQLEPIIEHHLQRLKYRVTTEVMGFVGNYRQANYSEEVFNKQYELLVDVIFQAMMNGRKDLGRLRLITPDGRNIVELLPPPEPTRSSLEQVFLDVKPILLEPDMGFKEVRDLVLKASRDEQAKTSGIFWERWEKVADQYVFPETEVVMCQKENRLSMHTSIN